MHIIGSKKEFCCTNCRLVPPLPTSTCFPVLMSYAYVFFFISMSFMLGRLSQITPLSPPHPFAIPVYFDEETRALCMMMM